MGTSMIKSLVFATEPRLAVVDKTKHLKRVWIKPHLMFALVLDILLDTRAAFHI